ncbi:uncharacterized protein LOC124651425 [Lolium rigidum]|uniref:uncharacterized protein LOC124651425 n=1 Tax=Lolium rigidum TaxID=89674 RepID=UPI001F5D52D7|nr:uncharacterized protein LOC124651425 [Lolium rigidum]
METMFMQVFEHRDWVEAQMRQQVASSSDSIACSLIAAGSRPPAWLLPQLASAIVEQGNTLRKPPIDLANLKKAHVVHLAPPTNHQVSKPKPLEFRGVKPGSCNITGSSERFNQSKSCMSEAILTKFASVHPPNEDLSATISHEASLHEVLHSVSSPLPEEETTHAAANYSLEGPNSVANPLLENALLQSGKPNFLEGIDSMAGPMPGKDTVHTAEIDFLEGPTSGAQEMLGSPQNKILDDDRGHSPQPQKNMLEDGCRHDSHSHVCGAFNTFSLQSAANLEKLLPNSANDERLYQNIIPFPGTINHNDFCSASASDAFISTRSDPFQMQTSLPKLSPEFVRTAKTGDAHIGSSSLSTANKSLQIKPVLDSVSCHLKQSGHAESKLLIQTEAYDVSPRNNMGKCVTSTVIRGASSEGAQILQTAERNSTPSAKECLDSSCERVAMNCQSSSSASLVPQYSQSHYLENGLDKVSNSSPNYSNTFFDGDACCISKKISCFANPDTDVKVATIEDKILTGIDFVAFRSGVLNTENYPITDSPTTDPRYALYQKNHHASLEFDEKGIDDGKKVSHGSIPWQNVDIYADYDETAQQCESFNIPIPSKNKSSTVKERTFVGLCESEKLIHLSCNLSRKYKMGSKMKPLCGKYESLAARFEKLVSQCSVDSVDTKWHDPSYDINNLGIPGEYSLEFDDSLLMSNVQTYGSGNANSVQEDSNIPLTPSAHKTDQAMKNPKENHASSIRKGEVSQPLHDRESRAALLNRKNPRHRSKTNLGKGWKPFVPLVKQNQQFRTACGKALPCFHFSHIADISDQFS